MKIREIMIGHCGAIPHNASIIEFTLRYVRGVGDAARIIDHTLTDGYILTEPNVSPKTARENTLLLYHISDKTQTLYDEL